jgi:hypothetical protein
MIGIIYMIEYRIYTNKLYRMPVLPIEDVSNEELNEISSGESDIMNNGFIESELSISETISDTSSETTSIHLSQYIEINGISLLERRLVENALNIPWNKKILKYDNWANVKYDNEFLMLYDTSGDITYLKWLHDMLVQRVPPTSDTYSIIAHGTEPLEISSNHILMYTMDCGWVMSHLAFLI